MRKNSKKRKVWLPENITWEDYMQYMQEQPKLKKIILESYKKMFNLKDENLDAFRLIILEVHMRLEKYINATLSLKFVKDSLAEKDYDFFQDELLSKITFDGKLSILKKLKLISKATKELATDINTLRNRLVHSTKKEATYKGENIIKSNKTIAMIKKIVDEYFMITDDIFKKVEEKKLHLIPHARTHNSQPH